MTEQKSKIKVLFRNFKKKTKYNEFFKFRPIRLFFINKHTMKQDDFFKILENKNIAVIGNSQSLFDKNFGENIDSNDIIIRINMGSIKDPSKQGSRTDIWATAIGLEEQEAKKLFNHKYSMWLSKRIEFLPKYSETFFKKMFVYQNSTKKTINRNISDGEPTSGAKLLDFLIANKNFKSLNIYGFDFFATCNFVDKNPGCRSHNFPVEKEYIMSLIDQNEDVTLYQ